MTITHTVDILCFSQIRKLQTTSACPATVPGRSCRWTVWIGSTAAAGTVVAMGIGLVSTGQPKPQLPRKFHAKKYAPLLCSKPLKFFPKDSSDISYEVPNSASKKSYKFRASRFCSVFPTWKRCDRASAAPPLESAGPAWRAKSSPGPSASHALWDSTPSDGRLEEVKADRVIEWLSEMAIWNFRNCLEVWRTKRSLTCHTACPELETCPPSFLGAHTFGDGGSDDFLSVQQQSNLQNVKTPGLFLSRTSIGPRKGLLWWVPLHLYPTTEPSHWMERTVPDFWELEKIQRNTNKCSFGIWKAIWKPYECNLIGSLQLNLRVERSKSAP